MAKNQEKKKKLLALLLLNLTLCVVFFLLSEISEPSMVFGGWQLKLLLVLYPLTAIVYGVAMLLTAQGDWRYLLLMSITFFCVTLLHALTGEVIEPPAALVYTGIMLAAALLCTLLVAALRALKKIHKKKGYPS